MNDELSPEDELRLNVLFNQDLKAVRIDESTMTLWAKTPSGEASVPLKPNDRSDRYLRRVRELLSGHALGSPGGYPVHLTRWTRQGQTGISPQHLAQLLLVAEEEAVAAVVHSPALTDDLAELAWWCMPTIDNARLMLMRDVVCKGRMGPVLAHFLIDHLAFLHEDDIAILDTVAVMLYSGVLSEDEKKAIWKRGTFRNAHYVPFLEMLPDDLPLARDAHAKHAEAVATAGALPDNAVAALLARALSEKGQAFLMALHVILDRPEVQEVVNHTLNAQWYWLKAINELDAAARMAQRDALAAHAPELAPLADALLGMTGVNSDTVREIFLRTTAIGSLMRRKIKPVVDPLIAHISLLRGI